jgi:hypothetical protein
MPDILNNTQTTVKNTLADNLSRTDFSVELVAYVDHLIEIDDMQAAYKAANSLVAAMEERKDLITSRPELWSKYQQCLWKLEAIAIPFLKEVRLLEWFKNGFGAGLGIKELDFVEKIEAKLARILLLEERDILKKKIIDGLLSSNVSLFEGKSGSSVLRSVGDWLHNYTTITGFNSTDPLKREQYFTQSLSLSGISPAQREELRRLFNLFDYLKKSSLSPDGLEDVMTFDQDGKILVFNHGEVYEIDKNTDPILTKILETSKPNQAKPDATIKSSLPVREQTTKPVSVSPASPPNNGRVIKKESISYQNKTAVNPMHSVPQALKSAGPAFMFDAQDELEADKFRATGSQSPATSLEKELRGLAEEVIKKYNFSFKDEVKHRRFVQLFVSRLKDVRDIVELREALLKTGEAGGLGLDSDKADQVVKIIEDEKKIYELKIKSSVKPALADRRAQPVAALEKLIKADAAQQAPALMLAAKVPTIPAVKLIDQPVVPKEISAPAVKPEVKITPAAPTVKSPQMINQELDRLRVEAHQRETQALASVKPAIKPVPSQKTEEAKLKEWREEMLQEIAKVAPPVTPSTTDATGNVKVQISSVPGRETSTSKSQSAESKASSSEPKVEVRRPRVEDVKAPPRVLGPLEELKSLSLVDFRRLAATPTEALNKVKGKIDLIGEASLAKKLEAIKAWQNSIVYQLYLKLGRDSIEQGKTMATLQSETTLTEQEFEAIADFNTKLRF